MPPQAKGAAADVAAEALAVEEEALGAQPLHHVHPLAAKMADVAAAQPGGAVLPRHALRKGKITKVTGSVSSPSCPRDTCREFPPSAAQASLSSRSLLLNAARLR